MNDAEILNRITDRYMHEAGQDIRYAFRLLAYDFHRLSGMASSGFVRAPAVAVSGLPTKERIEALDIPAPESPSAANPGS